MDTENTQKCEQHPSNVVVDRTSQKASIGAFVHAGYQEQVYDPADQKKSKCEKPDDAGDGPPVIKTVCAHETKNPENISDDDTVAVVVIHIPVKVVFELLTTYHSEALQKCLQTRHKKASIIM